MKKRILSLFLVLALLITVLPLSAVAEGIPACTQSDVLGGTGLTQPYGTGSGSTRPSASFRIDSSVDYCAILGISQSTAKTFGETIRASLRAYDFDIDVRSLGIWLDGSYTMENALCAMLEHEVFYSYDMFMFGATYYQWYTNAGFLTRVVFDENDLVYDYTDYYSRLNAVHMVAEYLMENIKDNAALSDLQKALLLHDRLANWTGYDYDNQQRGSCPPDSYSAVGVLWNRVGVCQGYAETYAYMLDQCGILNRFVQSIALNHIWNIVTIDGQEYYVDVTWDDPVVDRLGQVYHNNFMVSLDKLRDDHNAYDYVSIQNDGRYDNYFWVDSYAAFQLVGNSDLYYLDNVAPDGSRYANLCLWFNNQQSVVQKLNNSQEMKWLTSSGGVRSKNYSTLNAWNGNLYINSAKTIYEYNPTTNNLTTVYTPPMPTIHAGIYGFTIREGRFFMQLCDSIPQTDIQQLATCRYYDLRKISRIQVAEKPQKSVYVKGEPYDFRGLTLHITYTDGTSVLLKNIVHGWDAYLSTTAGSKQVSLRLFDQYTTFNLSVIDPLTTPVIQVKNTDKGIQVSWNKVKNANKYIVYRSIKSGGVWSEWTKYATTTATSYTNTNPKDGKVYRYAVRAYHQDIKSGLGKSDSIRRLTTPVIKVVNAKTGTYLSWGAVTGTDKYYVYRSLKKNGKWSDWTRVGTTTSRNYTDKTAKAGLVYRYLVRAYQGASKSASSATVEIRRLTPVTVTAKKSGSTIKLSWKAVTNAQKYVVYRRVAGKSTWTKLYTTKTLAFTDKTAKKGVYYEYSVRAVNGDHLSIHNPCKKVKR